jgi:hypothetical protein
MNAVFLASFLKDIKNLRDAKLRHAIEQAIKDVEQSHSIDAVRAIKRLRKYLKTHEAFSADGTTTECTRV